MRTIKIFIINCLRFIFPIISRLTPVDEKMVVFNSFQGRGYSDNPKAIYEYMLTDERFKDYKYIWFIRRSNMKNVHIPQAKIVAYNGLSYLYYLARARYWVINVKMPAFLKKKKNQLYLQTWHGTPLKRLAHDIQVDQNTTFYRSKMSYDEMVASYDVDVKKYDYMISPNHFCTEVFQSAFAINRERLIETGYPRNDFITNATQDDMRNIKNKLHIPLDKKVILYAPTWRDNSFVASGYTFELKADFHKWKDILGDEYVLIFKPHYSIVNKFKDDASLKGFLYSIGAEAEINELYVISDVLITDYSSVFFDYAVLNRPIYFYMYDLEEYKDELRGFYLDIYSEIPGQIYENEESMLKDVVNQNYDYQVLEKFNLRFNHAQTGDCAKKVVDIVFK